MSGPGDRREKDRAAFVDEVAADSFGAGRAAAAGLEAGSLYSSTSLLGSPEAPW